jgi:hypothetical protein
MIPAFIFCYCLDLIDIFSCLVLEQVFPFFCYFFLLLFGRNYCVVAILKSVIKILFSLAVSEQFVLIQLVYIINFQLFVFYEYDLWRILWFELVFLLNVLLLLFDDVILLFNPHFLLLVKVSVLYSNNEINNIDDKHYDPNEAHIDQVVVHIVHLVLIELENILDVGLGAFVCHHFLGPDTTIKHCQ